MQKISKIFEAIPLGQTMAKEFDPRQRQPFQFNPELNSWIKLEGNSQQATNQDSAIVADKDQDQFWYAW